MENSDILLDVRNLKKYFIKSSGIIKKTQQYVKAVDDVSFFIKKGETFGLVGESGCGKSTTGRAILKIHDIQGGEIFYNGVDISKLSENNFKEYRKKMQMIFQDPYASLNPRMTVGEIVGEPLEIHNICRGEEYKERIYSLLNMVGLSPEHYNRYPHEFSGGQRQRVGIARALAVSPEFIVCDEPISALDVSIQAQVVNMLIELQEKMELTYLFIAHDLSMVQHISQRIGVMYLGNFTEIAQSDELYKHPLHPYTKTLLSSVPIADPELNRAAKRIFLEGEIPSPLNPPSGCKFRTRCKFATPKCAEVTPSLKDLGGEHFVACHLF